MNPATRFLAVFLVAGALPAPAHAAEEDTQLWLNGTAILALDNDDTLTLESSPRFRADRVGDDQLLLRGNLDHRLNGTISVGGGAAYVAMRGADEFRPHQQVTLSFGPVALRTRLEERFFEDADRAALRLRQRAQVTLPIADRTKFVASGEILWRLQSQSAGGATGVDQRRLIVALQRQLSKPVSVTAGYLLLDTPRPGQPDRIAHVPQLTLTWRR